MAFDRFVYFKSKKPTKKALGLILEDYFRGFATEVKWEGDRFWVTLVGEKTFPFKRISSCTDLFCEDGSDKGRYIEVWLGLAGEEPCIDVMTRQQDEATGVLASGFAALCARYWQGELEDG